MINIYLNNCCYNRPFDDLRQEKIKLEINASKRANLNLKVIKPIEFIMEVI